MSQEGPDSLVAHMAKTPSAMQETWIQSLGQEDPQRRKWEPTPVLLPGESHGQRSLVGYSPWGCKESDMTEGLSIAQHSVSYSSVYSWTLTKIILNKTQVKEETKIDIIDYLAISRTYKNLLNLAKALFRQKCIILNFLLGKKIKAKHKVAKHLSP